MQRWTEDCCGRDRVQSWCQPVPGRSRIAGRNIRWAWLPHKSQALEPRHLGTASDLLNVLRLQPCPRRRDSSEEEGMPHVEQVVM